jgi:hypothetical protein
MATKHVFFSTYANGICKVVDAVVVADQVVSAWFDRRHVLKHEPNIWTAMIRDFRDFRDAKPEVACVITTATKDPYVDVCSF